MELTIFKNIIYGELKPWSSTAIDDKFYRQSLTKDFIQPTKTINSYYKVLKELHSNKPNLFNEDGLEVYMAQKDTDRKTEILHPLVKLDLKEPTTSTQKFYHYLLKNETTRLSNRIFKCINKEISEIQQKEIVQNVVKSCKDLLLRIGTDQEAFPKTDLTEYVIPQLITNVIRLLKETELLYPHLLHDLPSDKMTIFGELLKMKSPDYKIDKITPKYTTVNNISLGIDNFKLEKDTRFSFGFNGNKEHLKSILILLQRDLELLNENKTTIDDLFGVLTSKNIQRGSPQIYIGCQTNLFNHIWRKLKPMFTNLGATSISSSNLFYTLNSKPFSKSNLEKKISEYSLEIDNINNIFNQL